MAKCEFCELEFSPRKDGKGRFCSRSCFYSSGGKICRCETCDKQFKAKIRDKGRFCSRKCHYESKGCWVECKNCNNQFRVQPHQVDCFKFCSFECRENHYQPFDYNGFLSKICTVCMEVKSVDDFYKNSKVKSGLNSSCKTCENDRRRNFNQTEEGKKNVHKHNRTISRRYHSAKCGAKRRGIDWKLTKEEYIEMVESASCHYCGKKLDDAGGGLDRKNNASVYCLSEVVPCCGRCNKTFMDSFDYHERLKLAKVIREIDDDRLLAQLNPKFVTKNN